MDKTEFIAVAPDYYALAIIAYLHHNMDSTTHELLSKHYSYYEDGDNDYTTYFGREKLFEIAVRFLRENGMVVTIDDPFGPMIIVPSEEFEEKYKQLRDHADFPLFKYERVIRQGPNAGLEWIREALQRLDQTYMQLHVVPDDFNRPDAEWEPLPIEREAPEVRQVIQAIDETIEKVRSDNGYAATHPEEREYVLDGLSALGKRLKDASTISLRYLRKYGFEPLGVLTKRFKDAAIAIVATAAKEALRDWLRKRGITLLDDLF